MKPMLRNSLLRARQTKSFPTPQSFSQPSIQTCQGIRFASMRRDARPARMVLSNNVRRPPPLERKRESEGPFGGMNRRVANVDPRQREREALEKSSRTRNTTDDRKALRMNRALVSVSYRHRSHSKHRMADYDSFEKFDLLPSLLTGIYDELFKGLKDICPTPVQRLAIPALLGQTGNSNFKDNFSYLDTMPKYKQTSTSPGNVPSFLLAAETGSGKTLAYLLPAIHALKVAEADDVDIKAYNERAAVEKKRAEAMGSKWKPFDEPHPTMARPKVIILVPTAELCHQVLRTAKSLSHVVKFKSDMLSSDLKPAQIQRNMYSPKGVDLIVSTPHLLASMADADPNILSRVSHLIIDEADSLFDRSFAPVTMSIIERANSSLKQFVCCSATIPRKLDNYLAVNYTKMRRIITPNLHAIPRRVQLGVINVSRDPYRNNKNLACAESIFSIARESSEMANVRSEEVDVRRVMVFVNERAKAEEVADYLCSQGIDAQALHRDMPDKRHGEALSAFTKPDPIRVARPDKTVARSWLAKVKVLVVTDLASRGIDTVAVRYVILYDVPHTTIDFIHRLGRAGRMGRRGRGIVLVGNDDRSDVVADVKKSMFMGQALI